MQAGSVDVNMSGRGGTHAVASAGGYNTFRINPNFDLAGRPSSARRFVEGLTRLRHGTAEHGHGSRGRPRRERSRDRLSPQAEVPIRARPAGQMEEQDWLQALNDMEARLHTIEHNQRSHALEIAKANDETANVKAIVSAINDDITAYKDHVSTVHKQIDGWCKYKFDAIQAQLDNFVQTVPKHVEALERHAAQLESELIRMQGMYSSGPQPPPGMSAFPNSSGAQPSAPPAPAPTATEVPEHQLNDQGATATPPHERTCDLDAMAQNLPSMAADPWWQAAQERRRARVEEPTMSAPAPSGQPVSFGPASAPTAAPAPPMPQQAPCWPGPMPSHDRQPPTHEHPGSTRPNLQPRGAFSGYAEVPPPESPFHGNVRPRILSPGENYYGPDCAGPGIGQGGGNPGVSAWAGGRACIFEPSRKKNDLLFAFDRSLPNFQLWRDRMVDHFCRSTMRWRVILDYLPKSKEPVTQSWLRWNNVDGINAWDLATMLEAFLVDWFPKDMYRRRVALAGGERGNGFEMWRLLHLEYQGGSDTIEFGGVRRLQEFHRCNDIKKLNEHFDDWLEVLSNFGAELENCPRLLKSMILNIIPKTYEDELLTKPEHCTDYLTIMKWCRAKTVILRHKELSEYARHPSGAGHVRSLLEDGSQAADLPAGAGDSPELRLLSPVQASLPSGDMPSWAAELVRQNQELVAAVRGGPPPPKTPTGPNNARPSPKNPRNPYRAKSPRAKFQFKGCWHCGAADHTRSGGRDGKGPKCAAFSKLLAAHNPGVNDRKLMKIPPGYEGAYEKAKKAAGLEPRRRVNALDDEGIEDSDSESDFDSPLVPARMCALTCARSMPIAASAPVTPTSNSFDALSDNEHTALSDEAIEDLNNWAHKVSRKSAKAPKAKNTARPDIFQPFTIRSEDELDQFLATHCRARPQPGSEAVIRAVLKSRPVELECDEDEVLCLVDSGATINAAWIAKHFPQYVMSVRQTPASERGDGGATTACGKHLRNKGRCVVSASAEGQPLAVAFRDMEVEMPILSVRKMVRRRNDVKFTDEGGTITHRESGRQLRFFEHEGVYFLKLKIRGPDNDMGQTGFARLVQP